MEASKMHVMLDIKDEYKRKGMDNAGVAEATHKEKSVVDRQFAEKNGSQTLLTAYGYAEAAGGRVVFLLDEEWERLQQLAQDLADARELLRDRDQRLGTLSETLKTMTMQNDAQAKIIARLEQRIDEKESSIKRKEEALTLKDKRIEALTDRLLDGGK